MYTNTLWQRTHLQVSEQGESAARDALQRRDERVVAHAAHVDGDALVEPRVLRARHLLQRLSWHRHRPREKLTQILLAVAPRAALSVRHHTHDAGANAPAASPLKQPKLECIFFCH